MTRVTSQYSVTYIQHLFHINFDFGPYFNGVIFPRYTLATNACTKPVILRKKKIKNIIDEQQQG